MSRLVLRISLGILFVLVATFFIIRWGLHSATSRQFRRHFADHVASTMDAHHRMDSAPEDQLQSELAALNEKLRYPVDLRDPTRDELPAEVLAGWKKGEARALHTPRKGWTLYIPIRGGKRLLVLGPMGQVRIVDHAPVGLVALAILLVVVLTGIALAWPMVRRLRRLERAADRIAAGELEARSDLSGKDAVGRLASRFDAMAARVQHLLESQQQLIQAVAHELRTPVSRIRFGLEMLESEPGEAREKRLRAIDEDLTELDGLVSELQLYIRAGERALDLDVQEIDLEREIQSQVDRLEELRSGIRSRVEGAAALTLRADPRYLRRVLKNLLDNAFGHARSEVTVRCARDGDVVIVAVCDDGPGIPKADRDRVFSPFARLDESRSRESGGAGLGLAIVRRIVEAHDGTVSVEAAESGGACLVTRWPDTERYKPVPKADGSPSESEAD